MQCIECTYRSASIACRSLPLPGEHSTKAPKNGSNFTPTREVTDRGREMVAANCGASIMAHFEELELRGMPGAPPLRTHLDERVATDPHAAHGCESARGPRAAKVPCNNFRFPRVRSRKRVRRVVRE